MIEKVGRAEVLWHLLVEAGNDLVNGFLPAWLRVLAGLNGLEELAQRLGNDINKRSRNLN